MILKKVTESKNPITIEETTSEIWVDTNREDVIVILQPSDIGSVIPLGQNVIIKFDNTNEIIRTKSNNIIDNFIFGKFDEYEVLSMGSVKYGWLEIILAKISD